jgi:hypothetical protein
MCVFESFYSFSDRKSDARYVGKFFSEKRWNLCERSIRTDSKIIKKAEGGKSVSLFASYEIRISCCL